MMSPKKDTKAMAEKKTKAVDKAPAPVKKKEPLKPAAAKPKK